MNKVITGLMLLALTGFQSGNIEKTLDGINARFKNVEVSIIDWPDELHSRLTGLKKSAFMAVSRRKTVDKLPLLITLHGAGGKTWTIEEQLARSAVVKGLSLAELSNKQLMLLEPNASESWNPESLNLMLDYVLDQYPQIDADRVYVMGHSMGGRGTWDWIRKSPERFAAAAPCGFSGVSDEDEVKQLVNLPVWGMVGAEDGKNVQSIQKMVGLLRASGNPNVRHTEFPGANHPKGNAAVFSSVECVEWMLTFRKK